MQPKQKPNFSAKRPVEPWIDEELTGAHFQDVRLGKRLGTLLGMLSDGMGKSIPYACQDWANTKAAYRFFSNDRVTEEEILSGHFASTAQRASGAGGRLLVLHDTSEFSYKRSDSSDLGWVRRTSFQPRGMPFPRELTQKGILMHSSLVVTQEGLPLGLAAIKFWTREKFKGTDALKRKVNPTRIPIDQKESIKWLENMRQSTALLNRPAECIHIGDRESDIFELFCLGEELGTKFLFRTCVDRLAEDGNVTIAEAMKKTKVQGTHTVEVRDRKGKADNATLEIKFAKMVIKPPIGKRSQYPELTLTVIHAREKRQPKNRDRIEWKLLTNLPITSVEDVVEKLNWYALRWKIETFHKILKSGCRAEESKLRSAEGLSKLIAVFCIIGWRVFWLTMNFRTDPDQPPDVAFTPAEVEILDKLIGFKKSDNGQRTIGHYLIKVAQLGGYLARASDPAPGNSVMWKGMLRLMDIQIGFNLAKGNVGN